MPHWIYKDVSVNVHIQKWSEGKKCPTKFIRMKSTCMTKKLLPRGVNDEIKIFKKAWSKCLLNSYVLLLIHRLYFRILERSARLRSF